MSSSDSYRYLELNKSNHEIRLLTLLPGSFSSPVHISLEICAFPKDSELEFEALSYTWGSVEDPKSVLVRDLNSPTPKSFAVTQNLADALPYLRHETEARVLWIDAICVNQMDLEERSSQVRRMPDIFSKAKRVVVWLGLESLNSNEAMCLLQEIGSKVEVNLITWTSKPLSSSKYSESPNKEIEHLDIEDPRLGSLPNEWIRKRYDEDQLWTWYINLETGEERGYEEGDPRLDYHELLKRGAPLQDFVIS